MLTGFTGPRDHQHHHFVRDADAYRLRRHFNAEHQFGFEAASWYWHFVDVVWIGLFFFVYVL